jgi:hypothetical protein
VPFHFFVTVSGTLVETSEDLSESDLSNTFGIASASTAGGLRSGS